MSWQDIVEEEQCYLTQIGEKLKELLESGDNGGVHQQIYSGFWSAYQVGCQALEQFEADLLHIDQAATTGVLHQNQQAVLQQAGVSPDRWLGAIHIIGCLRGLQRPSEVFRAELRRQQAAIISSLQMLIRDPSISTEALAADLETIGEILCTFEHSAPQKQEESKGSWLGKIVNPYTLGAGAILGVGGYMLGGYLSKREERQTNPLLQEAQEEIEEQEDAVDEPQDDIEDEVIIEEEQADSAVEQTA